MGKTPVVVGAVLIAVLGVAACGDRRATGSAAPAVKPAAVEPASVRETLYRCESGRDIAARYFAGGGRAPTAQLLIDGKTYDLYQVKTDTGRRFASEQGLSPDHGLQWRVHGNAATLSDMLMDHTTATDSVLDACTAELESHARPG